jgi:hypothetical protein
MKIFGFRNLVGMALIGGAAYYIKQQGGVKNALNTLLKKKEEVIDAFGKERDAIRANGATAKNASFERH